MPAVSLGFAQSALLARLTRASLLQVLNEDYIRTARAKGLRSQQVVVVHAMKNAMIPVVTVLGPLFAALLTGTFVTERIFGLPGLGQYFIISINQRDYATIMGTTLLLPSSSSSPISSWMRPTFGSIREFALTSHGESVL